MQKGEEEEISLRKTEPEKIEVAGNPKVFFSEGRGSKEDSKGSTRNWQKAGRKDL